MMHKKTFDDLPLFALGFRAFFALAGLSALLLIALWKSIYTGKLSFDNYYSETFWHAHEMLLGYTSAVIAGFLLTAVKNWTHKPTLKGDQLAGLCLLWLYGRILPFYSGLLPDVLIALVDFSFLPILAYQISKSILESRQKEKLLFSGLLLLMALGNGLIHAEALGLIENLAWSGIKIVLAAIIMLILVIAGRIFPFFTDRGLSGTLAIRSPLLDVLSIASAALVFILDIFEISGILLALTAIAAVVINSVRIMGWYDMRVWYVPLLWILYIGYGWIIIGFILISLSAFSLIAPTLAIHAFAIGGIGVLTIGMMARVSLGHTGRALKLPVAMTIGFVLINLAALFRVFAPLAIPGWYGGTILISIAFWLSAFSLFIFVYAPILTQPRVDGKRG